MVLNTRSVGTEVAGNAAFYFFSQTEICSSENVLLFPTFVHIISVYRFIHRTVTQKSKFKNVSRAYSKENFGLYTLRALERICLKSMGSGLGRYYCHTSVKFSKNCQISAVRKHEQGRRD